MLTTDLQHLRDDADGVVAAAQKEDVLILSEGKVVAVVSKPPIAIGEVAATTRPPRKRSPEEFEEYWQERERLLADIVAAPGWDSTEAVYEDRDRA